MLIIDEASYPMLRATITGGFGDDDATQWLSLLSRCLAREKRFAVIITAGQIRMPSVDVMRRVARWTDANRAACERYLELIAVVTESAALRGAGTFFRTLTTLPFSLEVVRTDAEALARVEDVRLDVHGRS